MAKQAEGYDFFSFLYSCRVREGHLTYDVGANNNVGITSALLVSEKLR